MSAAGTPGPGPAPSGGAENDPWRQADRFFAGEPGAPARLCEVCGAGLDADQTYCLECGSPTPLAPRLQRPSRAAAFLAGALVALALGAGGLALAAADDDEVVIGTVSTAPVGTVPPSTSTVPVFTTPPATAPVFTAAPPATGTLPVDTTGGGAVPPGTTGTAFPTVTAPPTIPTLPETDGSEPPVTLAPPATATAPPATVASDWPGGRTGYTVVLSSVRDSAEARATATRVRADGEEAGVLVSSEHPNLRPGYYVVFSGVYDSRETALARADALRVAYPGAYAREVRS